MTTNIANEGTVLNENSSMHLQALKLPPGLCFGPFPITTSQAFHVSRSSLSYALVNIRPLLPGHSLVCPVRRVSRLSQLNHEETTDLFLTVKHVSAMLERVYKADALNVAVQDGAAAGQSVNHVHVHIIPRVTSDLSNGDELYEWMDSEQGNLGTAWAEFEALQKRRQSNETSDKHEIQGGPDGDAKRTNRSESEMRKEAEWLRWEMQRQTNSDQLEQGEEVREDSSGQIP